MALLARRLKLTQGEFSAAQSWGFSLMNCCSTWCSFSCIRSNRTAVLIVHLLSLFTDSEHLLRRVLLLNFVFIYHSFTPRHLLDWTVATSSFQSQINENIIRLYNLREKMSLECLWARHSTQSCSQWPLSMYVNIRSNTRQREHITPPTHFSGFRFNTGSI